MAIGNPEVSRNPAKKSPYGDYLCIRDRPSLGRFSAENGLQLQDEDLEAATAVEAIPTTQEPGEHPRKRPKSLREDKAHDSANLRIGLR